METTKTLRKYVAPSIGVLDICIERGFGDSLSLIHISQPGAALDQEERPLPAAGHRTDHGRLPGGVQMCIRDSLGLDSRRADDNAEILRQNGGCNALEPLLLLRRADLLRQEHLLSLIHIYVSEAFPGSAVHPDRTSNTVKKR